MALRVCRRSPVWSSAGEIWVTEPIPVMPPGFGADELEFPPAFCYIGPPDQLGRPVIAGGSVPEGWEPP